MKKIAIFTINDYSNYGNRLQNYATQEYFKVRGFDVETVKNFTIYSKKMNTQSYYNRLKNILKLSPSEFILHAKNKLIKENYNMDEKSLIEQRQEKFKLFTKKYINESQFEITDESILKSIGNRYDYYITGSDQVWNPYYGRTSEIDFLSFAPNEKKIAFSPSFGVSKIPERVEEKYKNLLLNLNNLSVREDDGAKIIKKLIGKDVPVLIDPTLLLDKNSWLQISKIPSNIEGKQFLLTYFLGEIPKILKEKINKIANEKNLEIFNLSDINDIETYVADPSEFIGYINNCDIFFTDSFHGAVFSTLLEKPFVVCQREGGENMYSRINTLLDKLQLNNRKLENINEDDDIFKIDFSHIPEILKFEREKVDKYISNALYGEEK